MEASVLNNTALVRLQTAIHGAMLVNINTIYSDMRGVIVHSDQQYRSNRGEEREV